jgi:RimJ/RimL family protein N-acetyltransferase
MNKVDFLSRLSVPLHGNSIRLEPLHLQHRDGLFHAAQDKRSWNYMMSSAYGEAAFDLYFQQVLADQASGLKLPFVVIDSDNTIVGFTRYLNIDMSHSRLEIGSTWYHPSVWGTGVNAECKSLLLSHAFDVCGIRRVSFITDLENKRSQEAIKKLGTTQEGVLRSHMIVQNGRIRDSVVFSILKEEWEG